MHKHIEKDWIKDGIVTDISFHFDTGIWLFGIRFFSSETSKDVFVYVPLFCFHFAQYEDNDCIDW